MTIKEAVRLENSNLEKSDVVLTKNTKEKKRDIRCRFNKSNCMFYGNRCSFMPTGIKQML